MKSTTETRELRIKEILAEFRLDNAGGLSKEYAIEAAIVRFNDLIAKEKQELLEIVDKEVIGEDETSPFSAERDLQEEADLAIFISGKNEEKRIERKKLAEMKGEKK